MGHTVPEVNWSEEEALAAAVVSGEVLEAVLAGVEAIRPGAAGMDRDLALSKDHMPASSRRKRRMP
jgi:hypothetical protein